MQQMGRFRVALCVELVLDAYSEEGARASAEDALEVKRRLEHYRKANLENLKVDWVIPERNVVP